MSKMFDRMYSNNHINASPIKMSILYCARRNKTTFFMLLLVDSDRVRSVSAQTGPRGALSDSNDSTAPAASEHCSGTLARSWLIIFYVQFWATEMLKKGLAEIVSDQANVRSISC